MDFTELHDLVSSRLGGRAVYANDEFFAGKANLVKPGPAIFIPEKYTARGKWMDGWETRRRRTPGHDYCVVALGLRGRLRGVDIDTSHFVGNQPEKASLEACDLPGRPDAARLRRARWVEILPPSSLGAGSSNLFPMEESGPWTHVRLNIFPDGGVARLRLYGEVEVDLSRLARRTVDLASVRLGGLVLAASDMHFGSRDALIRPGRSKTMADGWETRRRRGPGHDWALVRLAGPGVVSKVEIDTAHFKGNAPESASLEGCLAPRLGRDALPGSRARWTEILPRTSLRPHARHRFEGALEARGPFTHVRLNIFPDGGVSRLRIHGRPEAR